MEPLKDGRTDLGPLVAELVAIDSVNPTLVPGGAGEAAIAAVVARRLTAAGLRVRVDEVAPGRPNVVGMLPGSGGGATLLLLAHTDTVTTAGMDQPLEPRIEGGCLHGRGAYDMKAGLAAAVGAAEALAGRLAGDLIVAAVCDEEAGSIGTRALLPTLPPVAAAVVPEPTDLLVGISHRGFAGFEIETRGVAAHGSRPDIGEDAIVKMGPVLVELGRLAERHLVHASLVKGGEEESSYPARCLLTGEWRTLPGEDPERELRAVVDRAGVEAQVRIKHTGAPFRADAGSSIVEALCRIGAAATTELPYWTDAALLAEAGIPTAVFGPAGGGAHAAEEWVDLASVARLRDVLVDVALDVCGPAA